MDRNPASLDLALIGNCCISALVDARGRFVWSCFPRFDGDPVFHTLLGAPAENAADCTFEIESTPSNTASVTYPTPPSFARLSRGRAEQSTSTSPAKWLQRLPARLSFVRSALRGSPRIRIRVKPRYDYGRTAPLVACGSNHIRYMGNNTSLRLTTDAPVDYILAETAFILDEPINLIFGPDETLTGGAAETARDFEERTTAYWREWVHRLALPLEWQDAVIRAAITLKLCSYEPTGAIVAAMTTSVPEAASSARNWDYRFCWIRDAFFVVRALNSLAAVRTMELYFRWMMNIVASAREGHIQPVYGIGLEQELTEREMPALPGYRGMGPVRSGNLAYRQFQHDTYGKTSSAPHRRSSTGGSSWMWGKSSTRLETIGEQAFLLHDKPDAGIWELRTPATSSAVICWAGCDRLAKTAFTLGFTDRAHVWRRADQIKETVFARSWSDERGAFVELRRLPSRRERAPHGRVDMIDSGPPLRCDGGPT